MNKLDPYQVIDEFLSGELEPHDLQQFENAMQADDGLRKEVDLRRKAHRVLEVYSRTELVNHVARIHRQLNPTVPLKRYLMVAASVVLVAVVSLVIYAQVELANNALYSSYYTHYEDHITVMGDGEGAMRDAMRFYNLKEYDKAIRLFAEVTVNSPLEEDAMFYSALCYYAIEDHDKIEAVLTEIIALDGRYLESARWYLAMHYLRIGAIDKCKTELQVIKNAKGYKKNEAESLLLKLNNPLRLIVF